MAIAAERGLLYTVCMMKLTQEQIRDSAARSIARYPEKVNPQHRAIVEEAGAVYECGMLEDLVLFTSLQTGSTLAIPQILLTVENVRAKVAESNRTYGIQ